MKCYARESLRTYSREAVHYTKRRNNFENTRETLQVICQGQEEKITAVAKVAGATTLHCTGVCYKGSAKRRMRLAPWISFFLCCLLACLFSQESWNQKFPHPVIHEGNRGNSRTTDGERALIPLMTLRLRAGYGRNWY